MKNLAKEVSTKARLQRRKLRAKRKGAVEKATSYISGAFGLHRTPELDLHKGFEIIYQKSETVEPEIKFIDEKNILLIRVETLQRHYRDLTVANPQSCFCQAIRQ